MSEKTAVSTYTCECGKEFGGIHKYNGHKSHCKVYQVNKYGDLTKFIEAQNRRIDSLKSTWDNKKILIEEKNNIKKNEDVNNWLEERHLCEFCGNLMEYKYASGRFCSSKCSRAYSSSFGNSKESIEKKAKTLKQAHANKRQKNIDDYKLNMSFCKVCGCSLPYEKRNRMTCSKECYRKYRKDITSTLGGRASAVSQQRRSKNEIHFYELCEKYFKDVQHNLCIFNGWDADVIINDIKYAILWNGPWHYKKITKKHNLKQVQARDKLKLQQIIECGYTPYVIKDMGSEDIKFVEDQFNIFIKTIDLDKS